MIDVCMDTLLDAVRILPFLFITYLGMEYIEHRAGDRMEQAVRRSGKFGPLAGGILGIFPQCGFSAAAANLYTGRIITLGTLIAIFLSTSDEMLPIFISEQVDISVILKILGLKVLIGIAAGMLVDVFIKKQSGHKEEELRIEHMCEHEHCDCGSEGILKPAVSHTLKIFAFIVIISFVLNTVLLFVGEEALAGVIQNKPFLGPVLAGAVGLIPNCAASVVITQLYLEGVLGLGAMMAGLLVGAGIGLLVLFRVNDDWKENCRIVVLLYGIGVAAGIVLELSGLVI